MTRNFSASWPALGRIVQLAAGVWITTGILFAAPLFNATLSNSNLVARLDWSSDLGVDIVNQTGPFAANGSPVTQSASAVRDGRTISASITQTAPYILGGQYWAADWTGVLDIPAGGFYGLAAATSASGNWGFSVSGLSSAQVALTTFYYAASWDISAPVEIHPGFQVSGVHPVTPLSHGSATGSFTQQQWGAMGIPGFPSQPNFEAATWALQTNESASMRYTYRLAISLTPIGADVFDPPTGQVPEPATFALAGLSLGLLALLGRR